MGVDITAPFAVRLEQQPLWRSIVMTGELDLASVDSVQAACTDVPDGMVIIDLSELTFIDCAGYRALAAVISSIDAGGRRSLVVGLCGQVERLLALVGHDCSPSGLFVAVSSTSPVRRPHGRRRRSERTAIARPGQQFADEDSA
jgi:anti-anti-sigma factor